MGKILNRIRVAHWLKNAATILILSVVLAQTFACNDVVFAKHSDDSLAGNVHSKLSLDASQIHVSSSPEAHNEHQNEATPECQKKLNVNLAQQSQTSSLEDSITLFRNSFFDIFEFKYLPDSHFARKKINFNIAKNPNSPGGSTTSTVLIM